jgi:hypothetical protein
MVEEITTAIARLPWLFVIARNSAFTYKGKRVDVKQVAQELGVRYVLEGSVRKAANRVRITGQLIDTTTSAHIWADRFDGALDDIFELQDQVASNVAGAIEPKLRQSEIERAGNGHPYRNHREGSRRVPHCRVVIRRNALHFSDAPSSYGSYPVKRCRLFRRGGDRGLLRILTASLARCPEPNAIVFGIGDLFPVACLLPAPLALDGGQMVARVQPGLRTLGVWPWSGVPRAGVGGLNRRGLRSEAKPDGAAE